MKLRALGHYKQHNGQSICSSWKTINKAKQSICRAWKFNNFNFLLIPGGPTISHKKETNKKKFTTAIKSPPEKKKISIDSESVHITSQHNSNSLKAQFLN